MNNFLSDVGLLWLKESMIAILAMLTLSALLCAYWRLGHMPPENTPNPIPETTKTQMANVEKVATSLFGIVAAFVGYYAGRVPAERSAAASQQAAEAERKVADEKKAQVHHATALLAEARDRLVSHAAAAGAPEGNQADRLSSRINEFIRTAGGWQ